MIAAEIKSFPPEVISRLKCYVYRLIDPRNGETFYVGRGTKNRVFSHIRTEKTVQGDDYDNNKINRIREIHLAGFEVGHVIHRHGMEEKVARQVEAALIDAYPGLTNIVGGVGVGEFGTMHAKEIVCLYEAKPANFRHHKALLIRVNRTASEQPLYEATRYAWKINKTRAKQAEVVLATLHGLIIGAFVVDDWLDATAKNFPGREDAPGRIGFVGRAAPREVQRLFLNRRVPDEYRKRGAANPIQYTW
jgi:hypothetical protein